MLFLIFILI